MGGASSRDSNLGRSSSYNPSSSTSSSSSSSWNQQPSYPPPPTQPSYDHSPYPQSSYYTQETPYYAQPPPQPSQPTPPSYAGGTSQPKKRLERRYSRIADDYTSLDQVTAALARAGLESSNLIIGVDFTKSNEWTGSKSFNRKSLHHIGNALNPYEQAITIVGKTLAAFDEDNMIPCFGFGDASTHDQDVFSFYPDGSYCNGFEEVLSQYREITPQLKLAGPTSFAPIVEMAMTIVEESGGQYHVLVIIADGQVTRSIDTEHGQLSPQEQKTVDAIVAASKYPLSIVLVGVGDGPWDMMKEFDDNIPARDFDNFQFVNFTEIMAKNTSQIRKETEFALSALMEIPSQYKATLELGILGRRTGTCPQRVALPTPMYNTSYGTSKTSRATSFQNNQSSFAYRDPTPQSSFAYRDPVPPPHAAPPPPAPSSTAPSSTYEQHVCPICLTNNKDMAFGCGHQTCCDCGQDLEVCPICRRHIDTRIRLY